VTLFYDSTYEHGVAQEEFIWVISGDSAKLRKYWVHQLRLSPDSAGGRVVSLSNAPVRFVPVLASRTYIDGLQRFYREHLAIDVEVTSPLDPDRSAWDAEREQWIGERLIEQLAHVSGTDDAVVIGVLGDDMYIVSRNWQYAFAMRGDNDRVAIVSYARMNPLFWGEPRDTDRLQARLRKMVTKELGLMRFGLLASSNPESPMYRNIGGVEDLDIMHDDLAEGGFPTRLVAEPRGQSVALRSSEAR